MALASTMLGYQESSPNGFHTWPPSSWSMNRPTRVPASIVVRMNSASNMIAKWYQMAVNPAPPSLDVAEAKMWAMPTASDGAPPVRDMSVVSPMALVSAVISAAENVNPQLWIVWAAWSSEPPRSPAGALIAK